MTSSERRLADLEAENAALRRALLVSGYRLLAAHDVIAARAERQPEQVRRLEEVIAELQGRLKP